MIMIRYGADAVDACRVANAIEKVGGKVISVALNGSQPEIGALGEVRKFVVFARIDSDEPLPAIDWAIIQEREKD